jgi:hypothetical protein
MGISPLYGRGGGGAAAQVTIHCKMTVKACKAGRQASHLHLALAPAGPLPEDVPHLLRGLAIGQVLLEVHSVVAQALELNSQGKVLRDGVGGEPAAVGQGVGAQGKVGAGAGDVAKGIIAWQDILPEGKVDVVEDVAVWPDVVVALGGQAQRNVVVLQRQKAQGSGKSVGWISTSRQGGRRSGTGAT